MQYRIRNAQEQRGAKTKDFDTEAQNIEIYSTLLSIMSTEILCTVYNLLIIILLAYKYLHLEYHPSFSI